jgi:hypothetical protein
MYTNILVGKPEEDHLGDQEWNENVKEWAGFIWLRTGSSGGLLGTVVNLQFQ